MKNKFKFIVIASLSISNAFSAEFQKLGKAVSTVLGSTKATKKSVTAGGATFDVFTFKDASGAASKYAFIQKGIYAPNCTHTWVVGVDAKKSTVTNIQVVEMSCPHAFPTKEESFLSQYTGKGPVDVKKLSTTISTVAKATGSADLTTKAVERSILVALQLKGK